MVNWRTHRRGNRLQFQTRWAHWNYQPPTDRIASEDTPVVFSDKAENFTHNQRDEGPTKIESNASKRLQTTLVIIFLPEFFHKYKYFTSVKHFF